MPTSNFLKYAMYSQNYQNSFYQDVDSCTGVAQCVVDGKTDCGGMALLFSAVMRSNQIPAR